MVYLAKGPFLLGQWWRITSPSRRRIVSSICPVTFPIKMFDAPSLMIPVPFPDDPRNSAPALPRLCQNSVPALPRLFQNSVPALPRWYQNSTPVLSQMIPEFCPCPRLPPWSQNSTPFLPPMIPEFSSPSNDHRILCSSYLGPVLFSFREVLNYAVVGVAGLTCHRYRPFTVASCSRDSTVRVWSLAQLAFPLQVGVLIQQPWDEFITASSGNARCIR